MTKEEAKEYIYDCLDHSEATEVIKALEQEPITWIVGKDNCQVAVRNMPIDKMKKICAIIEEEGQQLCEDMRDATEEERKSTKDYIDSISNPTGLQFDDMYEELDFVQSHKKLSVNLQPCEDCISREDAINELKLAYFNKDLQSAKDDPCIVDAMTDWAIRTIKRLPSVTPHQKWIPVSERLPNAYEFVNCTCHSLIDDREDWVIETVYIPQPSYSPYSDWGNIPMLNSGDCKVVAWMHRDIPEPYNAESEDKE